MKRRGFLSSAIFAPPLAVSLLNVARAAGLALLNLSYDPTREFYRETGRVFAAA